MLADIKNDLLFLLNILESIEKIKIYTDDFDTADDLYFYDEQVKFNAALNLLTNIGETLRKISHELKEQNNEIDWKEIQNLRNRLAHDYVGINIYKIFEIIKIDIPQLKVDLYTILNKYLTNDVFDKEEFQAAKGSFYYRHIDFDMPK